MGGKHIKEIKVPGLKGKTPRHLETERSEKEIRVKGTFIAGKETQEGGGKERSGEKRGGKGG